MAAAAESRDGRFGPVGRWRAISGLTRALADTGGADIATLARLLVGLTAPVRALDDLAVHAGRALDGDAHARCELRSAIAALQAVAPDTGRVIAGAERGLRRCPADESGAVLDEGALGALLMAVDAEYRNDGPQASEAALDAVAGLVAATGLLSGLSASLSRGGHEGLVSRLEHQADLGRLTWVGTPQPMSTMSGSMPGMPDLPDIPGPPGLPGFPKGGIDPIVDELLERLRKPPRWDPDIWDHVYPWWEGIVNHIDPWELSEMRCFLQLRRLLGRRKASLPPVPTGRVTWNDGITAITQSGACGGDKLTIRGSGFGATQPPGVAVLVPTSLGCRPVAPDSWSDTAITVTLPANVKSGAIGFGDAAYIALYDAWADEQNALAAEIRRLKCGAAMSLPHVPGFHECPPSSPITHLQAGAPVISAFTANWAGLAVVEPTDPITLRWTVANTLSVRLDRLSAAGPLFAGSASVVDPPGTSYALGAPANGARAVYRYRLTATGPCGTATRDVTVVAVKRPRLSIGATEVTQSIQTAPATVRLVERKPTVVRVTVRHGLAGWGPNAVAGVRGRIRVRRGVQVSPWYDAANGSLPMAATPGASITVSANPQRNLTNDTLNFVIPPAWCTGTVWFQIEVRVAGFGAGDGFAGYDQLVTGSTGTFLFEPRRTLELRYIRVNWGGSTPSDATCVGTLQSAVPLLPTPTANIFPLAGVGVQNPSGTGDGDRNALLDDFDDRHNCSLWEALTEWLGSDCPDDDGTLWVLIPGMFYRGRAKDIPSNVCFTPPSDGPYAAHELAHCLNQTHVGLMCANGQQAQGGDPASAWPNNAQLADVPFDVTRNVALSLAGTGVFDVMTYCGTPNNTWPMPARWQRLWDRIG